MSNSQQVTESSALHDVARHFRQFCWLRPKELLALLKETVIEWSNDNVPRLGASLAFYTLLSMQTVSPDRAAAENQYPFFQKDHEAYVRIGGRRLRKRSGNMSGVAALESPKVFIVPPGRTGP